MTTRVFDCRTPRPVYTTDRAERRRPLRVRGVKMAAASALLLVPLAAAAERPPGGLVAALTALLILALVPIVGSRVHWGWLLVVVATAAVVTPRGDLAWIGPALFVATAMCVVLWLANPRPPRRGQLEDRPRPGSRERDAQLLMGAYGERHVGQVLARELPEEYVVINGLKLPRGAGDIDHLVVGPTGVFVLETKTMAGRIVCDADGHWRRTRTTRGGTVYAAYIGDPSAQVRRNGWAVRECLARRAPQLWPTRPWIEGLVVFAHPRTELEAERSGTPAVRVEDAVPYIREHVPRRRLPPAEVDQVVQAMLSEVQERHLAPARMAQSAQALVEMALLLPVALLLVVGTLGLSRLVQAQAGVIAVAHEAARAGALGKSPQEAYERMHRRVELVAPGLGLDARLVVLEPELSAFSSDPGRVIAVISYPVDLSDLPLIGWGPQATVRAEHAEWIDPFRSGAGHIPEDGR